VLTTGRVASQWHTRTRTGLVDKLNAQNPAPFIEMHPADMEMLGLEQGQWVRLSSLRGRSAAPVHATETIRRGLVFMPFHWGKAFSELTNINDVTNDAIDNQSGQPELKYCAVRVEPVASTDVERSGEVAAMPEKMTVSSDVR